MFKKNKFLYNHTFLNKIIIKSLKIISKKVDYGEILVRRSIGNNIISRMGNIENLEFNDNFFFSVTVYKNHQKGYAYSNSLKWNILKKTILKAIFLSKQTHPDNCLKVPNKIYFIPKNNFLNLKLFHPIQYDLKKIFQLIYLVEHKALKFDNRIFNSEGSSFYNDNSIIYFGNTYNIIKFYQTSFYLLSISILAKYKSSVKNHYSYSVSRNFNNLSKPKVLAYDCATKVLNKLNSKKISSRRSKVIFSYEVSFHLFKCLYKAIRGICVYTKSTFLLNFLNKKIFPSWLNIFENSQLKEGLGSRPFDNEGIVSEPKYIIRNGVLKTWLLDIYSSNKLNLKNTANSGGIYNWIVYPTFKKKIISFNILLKKMNTGLLINELIGQGVDINTGNYSKGVSGFWIENGKIQYSVSEITISGNLLCMFSNILAISNDINKNNKIQSGSILLDSMNISGI